MDVIDYNGTGRWTRAAILERYGQRVTELGSVWRGLSPVEHVHGHRTWVYPVMYRVIDGVEAGDPACICIGVEFIEEDLKFPFGKILKSNTARALRRAVLTDDQKRRIRRRVFGLLRAGHVPREFREYAKLVRRIGFDVAEVPAGAPENRYVRRYCEYFRLAAQGT